VKEEQGSGRLEQIFGRDKDNIMSQCKNINQNGLSQEGCDVSKMQRMWEIKHADNILLFRN
jgi:hypothetical protein